MMLNTPTALLCASMVLHIGESAKDDSKVTHQAVLPKGQRYCVDVSSFGYVCSDNPTEVRRNRHPDLVLNPDLGVPQRVDGTEAEKEGVREILAMMDAYYYGEVLSNPEYNQVRRFW